ncbi:hypothetical protein K435DRAFT_563213, partial [Dendrothele bispora CBS 962.96]
MTCHKSQGSTLQNIVVDLRLCRGSESPYVMLSRATSLDGVVILRDFENKKLQCRLSEDLRVEFKRIRILQLQTIL